MINMNKIRSKIINNLNNIHAIACIDEDLLDFENKVINITYEDLLNFIKNNNINIIKTEIEYNDTWDSDLILLKFNKENVSLSLIENKDYKLVEYILNKFNRYEDRISKNSLKCVTGVRWLGAFNTEIIETKYSLKECLEWEWSKKDREVACDLFSDFLNWDFIKCYKKRKYNSTDSLYKRCKLAFVYNEEKIRKGYVSDVWSRQLGSMLVASNKDYYYISEVNNANDLLDLTYHTEGFVYKDVQPDFILIIDKHSWQQRSLKIVEEFAKEKNITIVYINSNFYHEEEFDNIDVDKIKSDLNLLKNTNKDYRYKLDFKKEYIEYLLEYQFLTKYEEYSNIERLF